MSEAFAESTKDHNDIAKLTLSGTDIRVGTYDSSRSTEPSVYIQTEDDPEPVYIKVAEARVLRAALGAAIDYITKGE